jgi:glutathione S-transferase
LKKEGMAKLTYVNGRGRGEIIRFMLSAAEVSFEESFLNTKDDLMELRNTGKLMFGQVPLLEINGKTLTQTDAILRYLGRHYNMYGANDDEMTLCDMVYDGIKDCGVGMKCAGLEFYPDREAGKEIIKTSAEKFFPKFEAILKNNNNNNNNNSGFLVGEKLSYVDVALFHDLHWWVDVFGVESLSQYPLLTAFREKIGNIPSIANFMNSPQKKPYPNADYVAMVTAIFR